MFQFSIIFKIRFFPKFLGIASVDSDKASCSKFETSTAKTTIVVPSTILYDKYAAFREIGEIPV